MGKTRKRGKRGKHQGVAAPRSSAGKQNADFNRVKSALRNGRWSLLLHPLHQELAARWERLNLDTHDCDVTERDEGAECSITDPGEDDPETSEDVSL